MSFEKNCFLFLSNADLPGVVGIVVCTEVVVSSPSTAEKDKIKECIKMIASSS